MDLAEYERAKFELAEALRVLQARASAPGGQADERLRELFVRLAEDRFNLVVVGRFNRGKSSLMNAVLGSASLPVGVVPLTSVITAVRYGSRPGATIHYRGERLGSEVPLDALAEYVTQRGNPGNARGVAAAEVRLPAEILRRGFHFIDTPGLGSTIAENTRTTEAFIPQADAFVLVTSYESALSAEEHVVLSAARASARRVFLVLNKQDLVSAAERLEVERDLSARLAELRADSLELVSVSARDGLEARRRGDTAMLAASGIPDFERVLTRYLVAEKSREFLLRQCERALALAQELLPGDARVPIVERIDALAARVAALASAAPEGKAPAAPPSELPRFRACEVCAAIAGAAFDFLRRFQYDLSTRPEVQARHAERGGLCALHTWQYAALASTQGIASGYAALLERLTAWFRDAAAVTVPPARLGAHVRALVPASGRCALCRACAEAEAHALRGLARRVAEDAESACATLSTLCLAHLGGLLARLEDPRAAEALLRREAATLERLSEDMRRYATKYDAVRRGLASEEELGAARAAIVALVGLRNVSCASAPD